MRFDPESGVDHLVTERISLDSADQRAGRAGRTAPGRAIRLWDARDILRPHREPEIRRVDLASTVLDLMAWGGDPRKFDWFEAPPAERLDVAIDLLRQLGIDDELRRYPLHPRLARLIIAANGDETAIAIAAAISEGVRLKSNATTKSDGRFDSSGAFRHARNCSSRRKGFSRRDCNPIRCSPIFGSSCSTNFMSEAFTPTSRSRW